MGKQNLTMKNRGDGVKEKISNGGDSRKMQDVNTGRKFKKREYLNHKFRNNFGTRQEGHGLALLQKKKVMLRYDRDKKREEQRFRKQNDHRSRLDLALGDLEAAEDFPLFNQEATNNDTEERTYSVKPRKLTKFQMAKAEYEKKEEEKQKKREEAIERRKQIEDAQNKYKKKRLERYKILNKRTKKGQPVMKGRIELMIQKFQEDMLKKS